MDMFTIVSLIVVWKSLVVIGFASKCIFLLDRRYKNQLNSAANVGGFGVKVAEVPPKFAGNYEN
jgi:hypothetical protein